MLNPKHTTQLAFLANALVACPEHRETIMDIAYKRCSKELVPTLLEIYLVLELDMRAVSKKLLTKKDGLLRYMGQALLGSLECGCKK